MPVAFPVVAFLLTFLAARWSLGAGLSALMSVGYVSGVIRANYLGVYTTFMFDAAVLGFYLVLITSHSAAVSAALRTRGGSFLGILIVWPMILAVVPVNDLFVQIVSLRGHIWYLPMLLVGLLISQRELDRFARWLAGLNLMALAGAIYIYRNGIEALFPENAITELMYRSRDIGGGHHRIPSFFLNAHQYGGVMSVTIPLMLELLLRPKAGKWDRLIALAGLAAALLGILMCGARSPVIHLVGALGIYWLITGLQPRVTLVVLALVGTGAVLSLTNERFQRATTVADTESVALRIYGSMNESFLELLGEYPLGNGLGCSSSIPYFLQHLAPRQIEIENEYGRMVAELGWPGLLMWLAFLVWLLGTPPRFRVDDPGSNTVALSYSLLLGAWGTAFMGTGILMSVPGTSLMMVLMGLVARERMRRGTS